MKKQPKKNILLSFKMSDELRGSLAKLDPQIPAHWYFLRPFTAALILKDLIDRKPVLTSEQNKYFSNRLSDNFIGLYRIFGRASFTDRQEKSKYSKFKIYEFVKGDNKIIKLAKELRQLMIKLDAQEA